MADRIATAVTLAASTLLGSLVSAGTDAEQLRALHEKVMRAHRESDADVLLEDESADYVVASRGQVSRPTLAERRARLGSYLQRTTFHAYRDMAEPIVTVSTDGTMGWVIVQVEGRGVQLDPGGRKEALQFISAWVELYEKRKGKWYRTGNVSNFKEQ